MDSLLPLLVIFYVQKTSETLSRAPVLLRYFSETVPDAFQREAKKETWCFISNLDDLSFPVLHMNNIFQSSLTTGPNLPLQNPCVSWAVSDVGEAQGAHLLFPNNIALLWKILQSFHASGSFSMKKPMLFWYLISDILPVS